MFLLIYTVFGEEKMRIVDGQNKALTEFKSMLSLPEYSDVKAYELRRVTL